MRVVPTIYFCSFSDCNATFKRKIKYDIHIRGHTNERPFVCSYEECDKSYKSQSHLNRHELSHELSLKCPIKGCSEILKTKATLKKHVDIVHKKKNAKKYKCSICDEQFNKHNWLQRHMFRHTKIYPHVCPIQDCTRGFLMPSLLKRHLKRHKGYPCSAPGCNMVLSKWSSYVSHKKELHPREYKCDICDKVFAHSTNLKNHKKIHEEQKQVFPCEVPKCAKYFFDKTYLKRHVKSHHEKRKFGCPKELCSRAFKTQKELDDHVLCHGKKKPRKKKKHKPTYAAKLAGCGHLDCSEQKSSSTSEQSDVTKSAKQDRVLANPSGIQTSSDQNLEQNGVRVGEASAASEQNSVEQDHVLANPSNDHVNPNQNMEHDELLNGEVLTASEQSILTSSVEEDHVSMNPSDDHASFNENLEPDEVVVEEGMEMDDLNESTIDSSDNEFELEGNLSDYEEITVHIIHTS